MSVTAPFCEAKLQGHVDFERNGVFKYDINGSLRKHKIGSKLSLTFSAKQQRPSYDATGSVSLNKFTATVASSLHPEKDRNIVRNKLTTSYGTVVEVNGDYVATALSAHSVDARFNANVILADGEPAATAKFQVKLTPKSGASEASIQYGDKELIVYDWKMDQSDDKKKTGLVTIKIIDTLSADATFSAINQKGEAHVLVTLTSSGRKLKLDSTFSTTAPNYDMLHKLYYDWERNNKQMVSLDTKNIVFGVNKIDSKNELCIGSGKEDCYHITVSREVGNGKLSVVLPSERHFDAVYQIGNGDAAANKNTFMASITEVLANQKQRHVSVDIALDRSAGRGFFLQTSRFEFVDFDRRDLTATLEFGHKPNGHYNAGSASLLVAGKQVTNIVDVRLVVDEYCSEHAVFKVSAKCGGLLNANLNGNYHVGGGAGSKPYTYELKSDIAAPNTVVKKLTFGSSGRFAPATSSSPMEAKWDVATAFNERNAKWSVAVTGSSEKCSITTDLSIPDSDPISITMNYDRVPKSNSDTDNSISAKGNAAIQYGKGKRVYVSVDVQKHGNTDATFHVQVKTPFKDARQIDAEYKYTRSDDGRIRTNAIANIDDKTYTSSSTISMSDSHPAFSITIKLPNDTPEIFLSYSMDRIADRHYKAALSAQNFGQFSFVGSGEISFASGVDQFRLVLDADSAALHLKKVHAEISTHQTGAGKSVDFKATSDGKNIVSGTTEYQAAGKDGSEFNGSGEIKWFDQHKTAKFKLIRGTTSVDRPQDISVIFEAHVSDVKRVSFTLVRNIRDFQVAASMCQENNKCYVIDMKTVHDVDVAAATFRHEVTILVDLLHLVGNKEFFLKSTTFREKGGKFNHNSETRLSGGPGSPVYKYIVQMDRQQTTVKLELPKRIIATYFVYKTPLSVTLSGGGASQIFGHYELSTTSYLDEKNEPKKAAALTFIGDLSGNERKVSGSGALRFTHPAIREMKIEGNGDFNADKAQATGRLTFDIFQRNADAIVLAANVGNADSLSLSSKAFNVTASVSIKSVGLDLDILVDGHAGASLNRREVSSAASIQTPLSVGKCGYFYRNTERDLTLVIFGDGKDLVRIEGQSDEGHSASIKSTVNSLSSSSSAPFEAEASTELWKSVSGKLKYGSKFSATGEAEVGKWISFVFYGDKGREIFNGKLQLDTEHFMTSTYKVSEEDFKTFMVRHIKRY